MAEGWAWLHCLVRLRMTRRQVRSIPNMRASGRRERGCMTGSHGTSRNPRTSALKQARTSSAGRTSDEVMARRQGAPPLAYIACQKTSHCGFTPRCLTASQSITLRVRDANVKDRNFGLLVLCRTCTRLGVSLARASENYC
ncbi:hypothetical protein L210DRAFT_2544086 [Boletus edulis BED1]|uniref:Uncharacterized protein n=1 Tax=Boletus edulis BED1 TaxID=1328754 RepID=A0AAD4BNJ6_BOLED|nr:hypothetical protein L210DRAFT_2544086 [Boletus edulis BED1]